MSPEQIVKVIKHYGLPKGLTYYSDQGFFSNHLPDAKANHEKEIPEHFGLTILADHVLTSIMNDLDAYRQYMQHQLNTPIGTPYTLNSMGEHYLTSALKLAGEWEESEV